MSKYEKLKQRHPLRRDIILIIVLLLLILVAVIFPRFADLREPVQETEIIYIETEKNTILADPMMSTPGSESFLQLMHERPIPPEIIPDSMDFEWPVLDTFNTLFNKAMEEISPKPPSHFLDSGYSFIIINLPNFDLEDIYPPDTIDIWKSHPKPSGQVINGGCGGAPQPIGGPKAISNNLIYPDIDWSSVIEDRVILQAYIDSNGIVTKVLIHKSCGNNTLDKAAETAIKKTKFKPAETNDGPVGVWIAIPVILKVN